MVQRSNNRLPCFLDDEDRQRYLQCLRQALLRFGCMLHAYVLMSNHVHLLLTPDGAGGVSQLMQTFARNYVGSFNGRHGRPDPLLTPHPEYLRLGADPVSRASAYRALFAEVLPGELVEEIRIHLRQQKVLGTDRFRSWVEARTGRFALVRPVGRPPGRSNCP